VYRDWRDGSARWACFTKKNTPDEDIWGAPDKTVSEDALLATVFV